jgi:ABC-type Na+ efflux pump permease subunit
MRKTLAIAWKEVYVTFSNRNTVLIMIVTPLAISIIIGLAFSRFSDNDVPIEDIPVAIVNFDQGNDFGTNLGQVYVAAMVPGAQSATGSQELIPPCDLIEGVSQEGQTGEETSAIDLLKLTDAVAFDESKAASLVDDGEVEAPAADPGSDDYVEQVARAAVENGAYVAAIIIPSDFTQNITYVPGAHPQIEKTGVTIYANSGQPISGEIIRSVVQGITNQILTGNIAIAATFSELEEIMDPTTAGQGASTFDLGSAFACAFTPASNTIRLDPLTVGGATADNPAVDMLVKFGSAQAMFFALFTAGFGVLSMYDERRNWTLQRLVMSPTRRIVILAGKLVGVSATVFFQILILVIALSVIGSIMEGAPLLIWGTDLLAVALMLASVTLAVSGFGMFMAGIARTPEQGQVLGGVMTMALAILGGTFGFVLPKEIGMFSFIYWGRTAFEKLAAGQGDILLNVVILIAEGAILFTIGVLMFNRRFEVA